MPRTPPAHLTAAESLDTERTIGSAPLRYRGGIRAFDRGHSPAGRTHCHDAMAGLVVADRFKLKRLIGFGGTGQVWEDDDLRTKELVALKILRDDVVRRRGHPGAVPREADTIAALDHPGIARFVDYGHVADPSRLAGAPSPIWRRSSSVANPSAR